MPLNKIIHDYNNRSFEQNYYRYLQNIELNVFEGLKSYEECPEDDPRWQKKMGSKRNKPEKNEKSDN